MRWHPVISAVLINLDGTTLTSIQCRHDRIDGMMMAKLTSLMESMKKLNK